jgi:hypothetical protein
LEDGRVDIGGIEQVQGQCGAGYGGSQGYLVSTGAEDIREFQNEVDMGVITINVLNDIGVRVASIQFGVVGFGDCAFAVALLVGNGYWGRCGCRRGR